MPVGLSADDTTRELNIAEINLLSADIASLRVV